MNPIWIPVIFDSIKSVKRKCPHCARTNTYSRKRPGQFYKCKSCGRRFKETH